MRVTSCTAARPRRLSPLSLHGNRLVARGASPAVPVAPDQTVNWDQAGDVSQTGDERYGEEEDGRRPGQVDGNEVDVGGAAEARNLVPQGVEPEPGLTGVAAGLVHDPPLGTGEVIRRGLVREVLPVFEEEQGLGAVGPVEGLIGDEVGIEGSATGQGQLGGDELWYRPVRGRRSDGDAISERDLGDGL